MEGPGVEIAGSFVDQPGHHGGDARLVGRVLAGAAAEREVHGDQRNGRLLHQPDLDSGRAHHAVDLGGRGGRGRRDE